jgi:hypothetical protein
VEKVESWARHAESVDNIRRITVLKTNLGNHMVKEGFHGLIFEEFVPALPSPAKRSQTRHTQKTKNKNHQL